MIAFKQYKNEFLFWQIIVDMYSMISQLRFLLNFNMFSVRFHRMWNCRANSPFLVCHLDMPNSRNSATTTTCRIDNGFCSICIILASFGKSILWVSKWGPKKLRVAAFSGPPVCCFCQKCVKLKITYSSLDNPLLNWVLVAHNCRSTAASAIVPSIEVPAVLYDCSTVKTSQNHSSSSSFQWTGLFSCASICSSKKQHHDVTSLTSSAAVRVDHFNEY